MREKGEMDAKGRRNEYERKEKWMRKKGKISMRKKGEMDAKKRELKDRRNGCERKEK